MTNQLLLGDEAVAQGAIDAGICGAFSYPGTPATEIFEYIAKGPGRSDRISAFWSANEKAAYEEALGMSYSGKRALVSMKHVGLNVAADPFINSALTGVNGGLVIVVADDPGMHSSQNEQDSRYYGDFAQIPIFEPANQQEAYDVMLEAFDYSEEVCLPVLVRVVTRLSHSRANVKLRPRDEVEPGAPSEPSLPTSNNWTLVPAMARRQFALLLELQGRLLEDSENSSRNQLTLAGSKGVIASGLANNYLQEVAGESSDLSILKVTRYPIPVSLVRRLVDHCDEILVAEEGYPFIEKRLNGLLGVPGKAIKGKLSGDLPLSGELTPESMALAMGRQSTPSVSPVDDLAGRPPQLCKGCPHADSFKAIVEASADYEKPVLFSDIGCYTLGVMPPYRAVHSCVDMGASIAMAHGATQAGVHPVLCTIGDSTFAHSGMTPLIGAVRNDAPMTVVILDNGTVAMTGTQESFTCGERLLQVLRGLGVTDDHLKVIEPFSRHHAQNVEVIRKEIEHPGLSVVVAVRPCIHVPKQKVHHSELKAAGLG
jgi:indolepyruvate ferredoxin oxidoreductase alpha subunit